MSNTLSLQQIQANRSNAQESTGPRTPEGKAVSRMNASKHNILSRQLVVRGYKISESPAEFDTLYQEYHEHLAPAGPLEEMLVDQIVSLTWRLRRARTAETGEIALNADHGWWTRHREKPSTEAWIKWERSEDPTLTMKESADGNAEILQFLHALRDAVMNDGELTNDVLKNVADSFFGGKSNSLIRDLDTLRFDLQLNLGKLDPVALREKNMQSTLVFLDEKLLEFSRCQKDCLARQDKAEEAHQAAAILPGVETLDKILRYETNLERQLFRAINQLERLQRQRQGENVPPPLIVENLVNA